MADHRGAARWFAAGSTQRAYTARMLRHVWSVLCNQVFVDPETNSVALAVVESRELGPSAEPTPSAARGPFDLVTLWYSDVGTVAFSYKVKVTGPSGRVLADTDVAGPEFHPPVLRTRTRLRFPALPHDGPGVYWFCTMRLVDGQEVLDAEVPLELNGA